MHPACRGRVGHGTCPYQGSEGGTPVPSREVLIRSLGIGLVAIAAVVVSISVARSRGDARREGVEPALTGTLPSDKLDLDALRSAGL